MPSHRNHRFSSVSVVHSWSKFASLGSLLAVVGWFTLADTSFVSSQEKSTAKPDAKTVKADEEGWKSLFDGKKLGNWKVTEFGGQGRVQVEEGNLVLGIGDGCTGVTWKGDLPFPTIDYELSLEAMRVEGTDFFCGLTFPVGESPCSLICGGWGGGVVGLSSLDGEDAANNETTKYIEFKSKKWYPIKLRVTKEKIEAWIDGKQEVDVETKDRKISVRIEVDASRPLGICSWNTKAALRNIKVRPLKAEAKSSK